MSNSSPSPLAPVLVAIDFSDVSKLALIWAARQAQVTQAPLLVLHVVHDSAEHPGFYGKSDDDKPRPMLDVAEDMMQEFLTQAQADHPDLSSLSDAQTRLVPGLPAGRIVEVAEQSGASLVVLGNVGRSALETILLGSVADRVVHLCAVPVVIVKKPPVTVE